MELDKESEPHYLGLVLLGKLIMASVAARVGCSSCLYISYFREIPLDIEMLATFKGQVFQ